MDAIQHGDGLKERWHKLAYRYRYLPFVGFWGAGLKLSVLRDSSSISIRMSRVSYWFVLLALLGLGPLFSLWIIFGWSGCLGNKWICLVMVLFSTVGWVYSWRLLFRENRLQVDRDSNSVLFFIGRKSEPVFQLPATDVEHIGIESRWYKSEDAASAERTGLVRLAALGGGDLVICSFQDYDEASTLCHDIANSLGTQCVEHRTYSLPTNTSRK